MIVKNLDEFIYPVGFKFLKDPGSNRDIGNRGLPSGIIPGEYLDGERKSIETNIH